MHAANTRCDRAGEPDAKKQKMAATGSPKVKELIIKLTGGDKITGADPTLLAAPRPRANRHAPAAPRPQPMRPPMP